MLEISELTKRYELKSGGVTALHSLTIHVNRGEFFTFLGPSGCGKSTALRCIAGLETPDSGQIKIGDYLVYDSKDDIHVPANKRDYAMVFQSYAIWPHMTVFENVAFPLRVMRLSENEIKSRTGQALEMVGLGAAQNRSATLLSGGQQQRVALARAIVRNAKLLLLDEPLSNLDAELRVAMRQELRQLQQQIGVTTIYVTHDQDEALSLSDRIALMRDGKLIELGTPDQLYFQPHDPFTAKFIGHSDLINAKIVQRNHESVVIDTAIGQIHAIDHQHNLSTTNVMLMVRPEHIDVMPDGADHEINDVNNFFAGVISSVQFSGKLIELVVQVAEVKIRVHVLSRQRFSVGEKVRLHLPSDKCVIVPAT